MTIEELQLARFDAKYGERFSEIVEMIATKYESRKYRDHWYNQSIEPPEGLYWFLIRYASVYGRELSQQELDKFVNHFTSEIYYCKGYYFQIMNGQGSVVRIDKQE